MLFVIVIGEAENNIMLFVFSKRPPLRYPRNIHVRTRNLLIKNSNKETLINMGPKTVQIFWFEFFIRMCLVATCSPLASKICTLWLRQNYFIFKNNVNLLTDSGVNVLLKSLWSATRSFLFFWFEKKFPLRFYGRIHYSIWCWRHTVLWPTCPQITIAWCCCGREYHGCFVCFFCHTFDF